MGRSGTTLLDKLLVNHKDLDVLSQPLPLVFVETKKSFLRERGCKPYYVLNEDLISKDFAQNEFDDFLVKMQSGMAEIERYFSMMEGYSGQTTKRDLRVIENQSSVHGFRGVLETCLKFYTKNDQSKYLGTKEILCEEFLPYLCQCGYKCIVMVRDPRDVLASANYPLGEKYFGEKKPALFILRSWRKSVEFIFSLKANENFHFLRYEDLVDDPYRELDRITDFLSLERFPGDQFEKGVFDRDGQLWQANTSFEARDSFIYRKPKGAYKDFLSTDEIDYTEAVCGHEMDWLRYPTELTGGRRAIIESYRDHGIDDNENLPGDFSSQERQIIRELERLKTFGCFYRTE